MAHKKSSVMTVSIDNASAALTSITASTIQSHPHEARMKPTAQRGESMGRGVMACPSSVSSIYMNSHTHM